MNPLGKWILTGTQPLQKLGETANLKLSNDWYLAICGEGAANELLKRWLFLINNGKKWLRKRFYIFSTKSPDWVLAEQSLYIVYP